MNLARHATVLWRYRVITASGIFLGVVLALLATYRITWDGSLRATPRSLPTYTSLSSVLITQDGFPEGRVVLPTAEVPSQNPDGTPVERPKDQLQFADPGRFPALADLYAQMALGDRVRSRLPRPTAAGQIVVTPLTGPSGQTTLPALQFTTTASSAQAAYELNVALVRALRATITTEQQKGDVPPKQRIRLPTLSAATPGMLTSGPSRTPAILALLLCLVGTVALTHLLDGLRGRRPEADEADEADEAHELDVDGVLVPWGVGPTEDEPEPVAPRARRAS